MNTTTTAPAPSVQAPVSIFPILLVNFIGTLGYSIVLPFLVVLVLKFGGNELIYGVMGATYSFFQLVGAPILGNWSDRFGRRKILLLSQAGTFLAWVFFLVALLIPKNELFQIDSTVLGTFILTIPLLLLFVSRALDGVTGGNVSVANAYLADISTEEDRKKNFGKMSASANLGFIVGPALAGVLGATILGDVLPVLLAMLISLVAIFVIFFKLQEYLPCTLNAPADEVRTRKVFGQEHKECHKMEGDHHGLSTVLKLNGVPFILAVYFLIFLAFNFFYVAFPVHAVQKMNWSIVYLGVFYSILGGVMVLVQGPVLSRLSGKFSDASLIIAGSVILALGFALFLSENDVILFVAVVLFAFGNGIMWPSFLSVVSKIAGDRYQGAVQGFASSAGSLASIIGMLAGGVLYGILGPELFLLPAITMVVIFFSSFRFRNV